jgi:phosphoheptose isomerase
LLACSLLDQYERERPALPALSLAADSASVTAIGDSLGIEEIFSRQVRALGQPGDVLVCINSSPSTPRNLRQAFGAATEREMQTLVISAGEPSDTAGNPDMVTISAGTGTRHRTIEIQTMIIHCLCELLDQHLFGPIHRES